MVANQISDFLLKGVKLTLFSERDIINNINIFYFLLEIAVKWKIKNK